MLLYQILAIYYTWKNKNNRFKILLPNGIKSLMSQVLYQAFKIIFKHKAFTDNPPVKIFVNKIENRVALKIKVEYYLELLTRETMQLLGSTKSKIAKGKNGENVPHLEITGVILVHCNIVSNDYQ